MFDGVESVPNISTVDEYFLRSYKRRMLDSSHTDKLLSVAEAAALLGVHRTRINQLIDKGDLVATRIGRAFIIREADLELVRNRPAPGRPPKSSAEEKATSAGKKHAAPAKPSSPEPAITMEPAREASAKEDLYEQVPRRGRIPLRNK